RDEREEAAEVGDESCQPHPPEVGGEPPGGEIGQQSTQPGATRQGRGEWGVIRHDGSSSAGKDGRDNCFSARYHRDGGGAVRWSASRDSRSRKRRPPRGPGSAFSP